MVLFVETIEARDSVAGAHVLGSFVSSIFSRDVSISHRSKCSFQDVHRVEFSPGVKKHPRNAKVKQPIGTFSPASARQITILSICNRTVSA